MSTGSKMPSTGLSMNGPTATCRGIGPCCGRAEKCSSWYGRHRLQLGVAEVAAEVEVDLASGARRRGAHRVDQPAHARAPTLRSRQWPGPFGPMYCQSAQHNPPPASLVQQVHAGQLAAPRARTGRTSPRRTRGPRVAVDAHRERFLAAAPRVIDARAAQVRVLLEERLRQQPRHVKLRRRRELVSPQDRQLLAQQLLVPLHVLGVDERLRGRDAGRIFPATAGSVV